MVIPVRPTARSDQPDGAHLVLGAFGGPFGLPEAMAGEFERVAEVSAAVIFAGDEGLRSELGQWQPFRVARLAVQACIGGDEVPALGQLPGVAGKQLGLVGEVQAAAVVGRVADADDQAHRLAATTHQLCEVVRTVQVIDQLGHQLLRVTREPAKSLVDLQLALGLRRDLLQALPLGALPLGGLALCQFGLLALVIEQVIDRVVGVEAELFAAPVALHHDLVQPGVALLLQQALLDVAHGVEADRVQARASLFKLGDRLHQGAADGVEVAE